MDDTPRSDDAADEAGQPAMPPRLLAELAQLGAALKHLFGAQWRLFLAELGLARGAVSLLFAAGLAAIVAGLGCGLTVLALVGMALAKWFGSWLWALVGLALLQGLFLVIAIVLFRRGLYWMTLPSTRGEFGAMMRDAAAKVRPSAPTEPASPNDDAPHKRDAP